METKPNILIFMSDQQRGDSVLPGSKAIMPNIEKFRKESVTFTNAFCPSPHCCPSRATFFSGLYPSEHGVWNNVDVGSTLSRGLNDGVRLWCEDLRDAGYRMEFNGKWHVSAEETASDRGWNNPNGFPASAPRKSGEFRPKPKTLEWNNYAKIAKQAKPENREKGQIIRPGYSTYSHFGEMENPFNDETVVNNAIKALKDSTKDGSPFCNYIGTCGPHDPYFVPKEFLDMYNIDDISLPANFEDRMNDKPGLYRRTRQRFDQLSPEEHREGIRHYLAFCSYEDWLFGKVLSALEESGQAKNTIVIYLSDHGDYMGEHGLWCKGLPCFRGAYNIPAIVRWPGETVNPGRLENSIITLADFAPTILDACGLTIERSFAGRSLRPFIKNQIPSDWSDAFFTQSNGNELYGIQRSVSTRDWKYVYNGFDFDELYDLRNDPGETRNLINDTQYADIVKEMCKRLWTFAYSRGDVCINSYIMVSHAPHGPAEAFR
ncbi:MAG TPA: sulfatase-like hydrolase/transferase [Victivallales bacterium]|nr:sulfatase-like hydrolase/transferase [Victivallales bacterium]